MIYIPSAQVILEEDEEELEYSINVPNAAARSQTRRERIPGLGIDDLEDEIPFATFSSTQLVLDDDNSSYTNSSRLGPRRSMSGRRSITSLLARKSMDVQSARHRYSATSRTPRVSAAAAGSSSGSHSNQAIPPATICYSPPRPSSLYVPTPTLSSTQWVAPTPSVSVITSDSGSSTAEEEEDITTYHANLARFKAERAERAAELGVDGFDADRQPYFAYHSRVGDLSSLRMEKVSSRDSHDGRNSGLSLGIGRGLRAYWGGGSSSSDARRPSSSGNAYSGSASRPSSRNSYLVYDEVMDRQALMEWWDKLGNEPGMKY